MNRYDVPREGRDHDAPLVALLLGFDFVAKFDDLPVSFRAKWRAAEHGQYFAECDTIGDLLSAYFRFITENVK